MGDIPNLPHFAAQVWATNDNAKELWWFSDHWLGRLRWLLLHLCFASFTKQNISGKKNWKSSCDWNIIHFFFVQEYTEISRGGFICAIAVTTKLTNQISLLDDEAKHKWLMFCFVLVNTKNILRHFCFVGMRACAGGANEAKHKWNITHRNLPNT